MIIIDYLATFEIAHNGRIYINQEKTKFKLQEFVTKRVWDKYGQEAIHQLDLKLIYATCLLRKLVDNLMMINTWYVGGNFSQRGKRERWVKWGAYDSQHFLGRAIDFNVIDKRTGEIWHTKETFDFIMDHEAHIVDYGFSAIEDWRMTKGKGLGWTHLDCRPVETFKELIIVTP